MTTTYSYPTARKPHVCEWCSRIIGPGEKYIRAAILADGTAGTWKNCLHCEAFVTLCALDDWYDEGLSKEDIGEFGPRKGDVFAMRCLVMWRRQWRRKDGTLYDVPKREATQ